MRPRVLRSQDSNLPIDPADPHLLTRLTQGDAKAFELLVRQYLNPLTRFASYMLGSRDGADDVVQQVFVTLWERRITLGTIQQLKPYLFRAVRNRVLNLRESSKVRTQYQVEAEREIPASEQSSENWILTTAEIQSAIDRLPERRQLALRLRLEEELSHAEIAEVLEVTPVAAQRLVARAIADLREMLNRVSD